MLTAIVKRVGAPALQRYALIGLGAALAAALVTAGYLAIELESERADHAETIADHAEERTEAARLTIAAVTAARQEEQRRAQSIAKIAEQHAARAAVATRDAAAAGAAAVSLRERAAAVAARSCGPASDSAAAGGGSTAGTPGAVLADVLGRADAAAGELAAALDRAHGAGVACQEAYDALKAP